MTKEQAVFHLQELINSQFKVPVYETVKLMESVPLDFPVHTNVELGELLRFFLNDVKKLEDDNFYLIEVLQYHLGPCTYPYKSNPEKQNHINEIALRIPYVKWPVAYEQNLIKRKFP